MELVCLPGTFQFQAKFQRVIPQTLALVCSHVLIPHINIACLRTGLKSGNDEWCGSDRSVNGISSRRSSSSGNISSSSVRPSVTNYECFTDFSCSFVLANTDEVFVTVAYYFVLDALGDAGVCPLSTHVKSLHSMS